MTQVAVVGPVPPPYQGMTVYTRMLLDELAAEGVAVRWIDSSDHRDLSNMGRIDWENLWGAARTAFGILGCAGLERPRLLYLPIAQSTLPFVRDALHLLLGRLIGMRLVVHLHGGGFPEFYGAQTAPMRWLVRRTLDACSAIIVLTPALMAQFDGVVHRPVIHVVANAVAPVLEDSRIEARYADVADRPIRVSFLAAITGPKGAVDFVRAIELLPDNVRSRAEFVIAGNRDGNFAEDYETVAGAVERLRGEDLSITLDGVVDPDAKPGFFADTDVFVLPSHREGQPLVILEALSAGCAVVSTRVGGIPETLGDGESGLLVDPGDVAALAGVLRELIDGPDRVVGLGRAGRELWERRYQPRVHGATMSGVLAHVLAEPRARAGTRRRG